MTPLWKKRIRNLAAALGLATLGGIVLAGVLSAAHDSAGAQAATGATVVIGAAFLCSIVALAAQAVWADLRPRS